jgi:hypothetical protein
MKENERKKLARMCGIVSNNGLTLYSNQFGIKEIISQMEKMIERGENAFGELHFRMHFSEVAEENEFGISKRCYFLFSRDLDIEKLKERFRVHDTLPVPYGFELTFMIVPESALDELEKNFEAGEIDEEVLESNRDV